jgi:membrane-bound lytic murein transglycosylase B
MKPEAPIATPTPPAQMAQIDKPAEPVDQRTQQQRFADWQQDFTRRALAKGYDADMLARTVGQAKIDPKALDKDVKQPEFTKPIWSYVDGVNSTKRIQGGKDKLAKHAQLFEDLENRYHVDKYILTSIWGLESSYGTILGDHDIIDALSTFAFEGRRMSFGKNQLYAVLDILKRGDVRQDQLTGSWAGAVGMTQFIPTTFRDYAVDYDGNGNKDLWANPGDALGSAANYLSRYGWRYAEPVFAEVILPDGFDYSLTSNTKRTVSGWTGMGIRPVSGQNWSKAALFLEAKVLAPAGAKGPAFLTFKNFDVIKKYNNSTSYALGITVLSRLFTDQTTIIRDWPRDDQPLSRSERQELQHALTRQGFDTQGVDGLIGPNSRRAIRGWQLRHGLPADGYVEHDLYEKIIAQ